MRTFAISTVFTLFIGILILMSFPEPLQHPCHPGGPGGPGSGPPCPPTPTPFSSSGGSQAEPDAAGLVGFLVRNRTAQNITLWVGDPVWYVLNVPAESEVVFTVGRGVYPYDLAACGQVTQGYLNLTIHTFIDIEACQGPILVPVELANLTGAALTVQLHGPGDYVISLDPGQTLPVTIARGEYEAILIGCPAPATIGFAAHAGRTIEFSCP